MKSGVYTDKDVPLDDDEIDPDEYVNIRTWFIQVVVWCMCQLIAKIFVFFFQFAYHAESYAWGSAALIMFKGHPKLELIVVMVFIPFTLNSAMFWVQDAFLKGDKHLDARKIEQEELRRIARAERREKMYNMGKGNANVDAAAIELDEVSEDEFGNVVIKKRINRQIEEGVYGVDDDESQSLSHKKRAGSIIELHDDLNAVDEDAFDKIIDQEKAVRKSKLSG